MAIENITKYFIVFQKEPLNKFFLKFFNIFIKHIVSAYENTIFVAFLKDLYP